MSEFEPNDLRIVFLGMLNRLSYQALGTLIAHDLSCFALVIPATELAGHQISKPIERLVPDPSPSQLRLISPYLSENTLHLAWKHEIPAYAVTSPADPAAVSTIASWHPEVICVACYPQRLPNQLLDLPRSGCLNLHPSLLPHYRGPAPLFWIFRNDDRRRCGVSIHLMTEDLDAGDILAQAPIAFPDGVSGEEADLLCGALGGRLLVASLRQLKAGSAEPQPQPPGGSYQPWPAEEDFEISTQWTARRAFNFMRATADWDRHYPISVAGQQLELEAALSFAGDETLSQPVLRQEGIVRIQFASGVLTARTTTWTD